MKTGRPAAIQERSTDTNVTEALAAASRFSNACGLPQTVYKDESSGGWWHTNSLADRLRRAEVIQTVLPENFFR